MVLFIIFAILMLGFFIYPIYCIYSSFHNEVMKTNYVKLLKKVGFSGIGFAISFLLMSIGAVLWNQWSLPVSDWLMLVFGGLLFGALLYITIFLFAIHYYGKEIPKELDKWLFRSLCIAWPLAILSFFLFTNGFANFLTYPLVNGLNFSKGWSTPTTSYGANLAFYALCILCGAITVYFLCDHKFYIQYGKHGILESTFLVAFPAGILGARIFYVLGVFDNYVGRIARGEWWSIFAIWEGGLTILGGAITGIVVGVLWYKWRNKGYSIWIAVDIIVPTILIAQCLGRWGNFFNCEVHGNPVLKSSLEWLPRIITNNMHYSKNHSIPLDSNMIYAPLFLLEGCTNLLGYFVIAHLFGNRLRKYTAFGDLAFGYVIWYGLTRVIMEPLRDVADQMNTWSWYWSFAFVFVGTLLIVANHLIRYFLDKKKDAFKVNDNTFKKGWIGSLSSLAVFVIFLVISIVLLLNNKYIDPSTSSIGLSLDGFNVGLIMLLLAISSFLTVFISFPNLIEGWKYKKGCENE